MFGAVLNKLSPGHNVDCSGLPGLRVSTSILDVSFDVVLKSLDNMATSLQFVLADDDDDGREVGCVYSHR